MLLEAGRSEWALPVALVREIAPHAPPRPVPGAPAHVAGVVNLRGRILPVVDLRDRTGESGARPAGAALVVAALPEGLVAVAVDAVGDVVAASPSRGRPRGLPLADGVARLPGGREVVVLDLARLAGGAVAVPAAPARAQAPARAAR